MTLLLLLLGACTTAIDIHRVEDAPVAVILAPAEDERVPEGAIELRGVASDAANKPEHLFVQWSLGTADDAAGWEPACKGFALEDGSSLCTTALRRDHTRVRMVVKDLAGFEGVAVVPIVVDAVEAPSVAFDAPVPPGRWYANVPVVFALQVSDADDAADALEVSVISSLQGELPIPSTPDGAGRVPGAALLVAGVHTLEATVTDPGGSRGRASVTLEVLADNAAPSCRFVEPVGGGVVPFGGASEVRAAVTDDHDAPELLTAVLTGPAGPVAAAVGPDGFWVAPVAWPAFGAAIVSLEVTDAVGAASTCALEVVASAPPEVSLTAPTSGLVVDPGQPVRFEGVVADEQTAPDALRITVWSSLDGPSSPFAAGVDGGFATERVLSPGVHEVGVVVTDAQGLVSTRTATIQVRSP